jgi:5-methylthioadenosine/S-adenosylhomocysteine deaminase
MDSLLAGGTIITMNPSREVIPDGAICVRDDRIHEVGPRIELARKYPDARSHDCSGRLIFPGLINTHNHLFQSLLKGLGDDMSREEWGLRVVIPSAINLKSLDVYAAARHACVESIKSGVTTMMDFTYGNPREPMANAVIQAFTETGVRGIVARAYVTKPIETEGPGSLLEDVDAALGDAERLIGEHNGPGARVSVALAPSMIWGVDRETLERTRALADRLGVLITTHVAETVSDAKFSMREHGMRELEFLERIGFLGPDVLAVHCVNCNERDIAILGAHDVKVSHNPSSNLYLGAGIAPIPQMLKAEITVGLGSDGPASNNCLNLIQTLKFAALIHKGNHRDPTVLTAGQVLAMATIDGAKALGLQEEIGSIEAGKKADIVVANVDGFSVTPLHNPVSALVYSALGHEPEMVLVDGQIVMAHQTVATVSEDEVLSQARVAAKSLARRAGTGPIPPGLNG